jgi:hypothetical protein
MARSEEEKRKAREYMRYWRKKNKEKVRETNRRYNAKRTPKPLTEAQKKRKRTKRRESNLMSKYGLTIAEYDGMMKRQQSCCAICRQRFGKRPHVDHDHKTDRVRGLLCHGCNTSLGGFRDDSRILLQAVMYLRRKI